MLKHLSVKNFAIIENIEVSFEGGMNVLTGETGAGKSLLIDAIGLLLGDRADKEVVRSGQRHAEVSGVFAPLNEAVKDVLNENDILFEDDELLIKRRISADKSNLIKCNGETITLGELRKITAHIADIHTQHDTKRLINPDTYLELLDGYDSAIGKRLETYQTKRDAYLEVFREHQNLKSKRQSTLEQMDLIRFQLEEIDAHNLTRGEEEEIESRLNTLKNFDEIFQSVQAAYTALEKKGVLEETYGAAQELSDIADYDEAYKELKDRVESAYFELDDIKQTLSEKLDGLDFDPEELDELETRRHTLSTLKNKYHRSVEEILDYREEIQEELENYSDYDGLLAQTETRLKERFEELLKAASSLSEQRKKTARSIETALMSELGDLELKNAAFEIVFEKTEPEDCFDAERFGPSGLDAVDFHLTTNKGEPLKPLKNVASGGELSRIMLALKTLLVRQETLNLMIFDEIDSGVSGYVASQVAKKMRSIAKDMQVLAITHLPQVAAAAHRHYHIFKTSNEERTAAQIKPLDHEGRIRELAVMISSDEVTTSALQSAEELLK